MAATVFCGGCSACRPRPPLVPHPPTASSPAPAVEACIAATKAKIRDPDLAVLFENCFPDTLDTTVTVKDGDTSSSPATIDAMWLRDSSAQVWPYLPLAKGDDALTTLFRA
ncbi:MAG: glycoside hydrolase family 125 protein [Asticcacaulis sp.]